MNKAKMLIEVAMPVKEISAESVRDKSIRHGHISTLHLWWARRPLPVCRAVVFASLIPDPLDENCPEQFKEAVNKLLGAKNNPGDPYKPYDDIPFTTAIDPMEDNLRNRLLMFIGKFSYKFIQNGKNGKTTSAGDQLSEWSLIKWDNKNNEEIINKARKLIWVAHDPVNNTLEEFDKYHQAIKSAENNLYSTPDRHIEIEEVKTKEEALQNAINSFLERMPKVFDPFAGGGAIPLEAARLGCKTYGNDINPVAHIIQKGSVEFPQKYGKPITYSKDEFIKRYGEEEYNRVSKEEGTYIQGDEVRIPNRLSFDVEYYAKKLLKMAEDEIGHLYPADENGNKPVAYYWARVGTCSNPSCKAEIPLLGQFYLANKDNKKIYLKPIINGTEINFEIKEGRAESEGWMYRANLKCPCCGNTTDVKTLKEQFFNKLTTEKLLAVIFESNNGKVYKLPNNNDFNSVLNSIDITIKLNETMDNGNYRDLKLPKWGFKNWVDMFSKRQLLLMQTLILTLQQIKNELEPFKDYDKAIITYLGILIDRIAVANTSFGVWHTGGEKLERIMGRQAIPMVFDYPESNPFCTSSGSAYNQLDWLRRYFESESLFAFYTNCKNTSSGEISQFESKSISASITDPPYYDAIAYADLSDFFYIWLKRTLGDIYPLNFAFPQTPKSDECTALKHHHGNDEKAKKHFENKLLEIFSAIEKQTSGVVSIMFAHQSTEAWTTLVNSILNANMNITGSWANDTEMTGALKTNKAFLSSSVTVSCRPSAKSGYGDFKEIKSSIEQRVKDEVKTLYKLGFRGADLLTACFGQAVSEFGKYKKVEKADGTEVTVAELLEMTREAAFNAIVSDIETDDITRFYIGWLNLFGFTETDHDNVRRITQIGLSVDASDLVAKDILIRTGNKESLADYKQRFTANSKLGEQVNSCMIDRVHKAMFLFGSANRGTLLNFISKYADSPDNNFWRVLNSLGEILPAGIDDQKQVAGLIANKESLIREAQQSQNTATQLDLYETQV